MTENLPTWLMQENWFFSIPRSLEVDSSVLVYLFNNVIKDSRFPGVFYSVIFSLRLSFSWPHWVLYLQTSITVDIRREEEGRGEARRRLTLGSENIFFSGNRSWHIIAYTKRNIYFLCGNIAPLNKIRLLVSKKKWRIYIN